MRELLRSLRIWFVNPRCRECGHHTSNIEQHYHDEHGRETGRRIT